MSSDDKYPASYALNTLQLADAVRQLHDSGRLVRIVIAVDSADDVILASIGSAADNSDATDKQSVQKLLRTALASLEASPREELVNSLEEAEAEAGMHGRSNNGKA